MSLPGGPTEKSCAYILKHNGEIKKLQGKHEKIFGVPFYFCDSATNNVEGAMTVEEWHRELKKRVEHDKKAK